jgi:Raf kinase inhibitor-like YbhB/YbcL family protein
MNARLNVLFATAVLGCLVTAGGADKPSPKKVMNLQITSTAFSEGQPIPAKYSCEGRDISPPLQWTLQSETPANAKSFALIMDDPDAPVGTWVHWVLYDLPANATGLPENAAKTQTISNGAKQGMNTWPRLGYGGPCPPPGKPHRYFFKLYALDTMLGLKPGLTKKDLLKAMEGHVFAEGQLMGTYQRK